METRIDEIADRIYRLSTFVPGVGGPAGFTFNQFLIDADEPLLFHCGQRSLFPAISKAVATVMPLERLRWISYSHAESDECGSLNDWLAAAPRATAAQGRIGCSIWLNDTAIRPPRVLANGEVMDLGGKTVRFVETPHVPHNWDAALMYEESTGTLFCSDLLTQTGDAPALTEGDVLAPALKAEAVVPFMSVTPGTAPTIRSLAALAPKRLALMHGPSFAGDGAAVLQELARYYDEKLRRAVAQ